MALGTVCDDDLDDEVIEISSDEKPKAIGPKRKWVAKHVKIEQGTHSKG